MEENSSMQDIDFLIKRSCGLIQKRKRPRNVVSLIDYRKYSCFGDGISGFTSGDLCRVRNDHLPDQMSCIEHFGHKIFCGIFSNDGKYYVAASQDHKMRLYDTSTVDANKIRETFCIDVDWSILDTAFSPDGSMIYYSSWCEDIHAWKLSGPPSARNSPNIVEYDSGQEDHDLPQPETSTNHLTLQLNPVKRRCAVFSLSVSNDGSEIACAGSDGYIYIFNMDLNRRIQMVDAHEDDTNAIKFEPSCSFLIYTAADDGICKVWDRRILNHHSRPAGFFTGHKDGITYIDTKGDGRYILTNSKDQSIKLWDLRKFSSQLGEKTSKSWIRQQKWDYRWQRPPSKMLKDMKIFEGDTSIRTFRGHSVLQTLSRAKFSPISNTGQRYIYTGCSDGPVIIYDILTGKIAKKLIAHEECVRDVSWHPYRTEIFSCSWDCVILRWSNFGDVWAIDDNVSVKESTARRKRKRPCSFLPLEVRRTYPSTPPT